MPMSVDLEAKEGLKLTVVVLYGKFKSFMSG